MKTHFLLLAFLTNTAHAEQAVVDVALKEPAPERHVLTVQWNPLALFLARLSFDVVISPFDHHALVLSPFFAWPRTQALTIATMDSGGNPLMVGIPTHQFYGVGGEIGYRYYTGRGGPRGFFAGPSFIFGVVSVQPLGDVPGSMPGNKTTFVDLGGALDVGFSAIVADRIAFTIGTGAQFIGQTTSIPDQQFPAKVLANTLVQPRFLLSAGVSF